MKRSCTENCSLPFAGRSETRRAWSWTQRQGNSSSNCGQSRQKMSPHSASGFPLESKLSRFKFLQSPSFEQRRISTLRLHPQRTSPDPHTHHAPLASPLGSGWRMKTVWFLHQSLTTFPFTHHSALFAWYRRRLFLYRTTNTKPGQHHKGWKFSYGHYFTFALFQQLFSTS